MASLFHREHRLAEIRNGCDELHHYLRSVFDRNFDKFELYAMRNVLKVPEPLAAQMEAQEQAAVVTPSFTHLTVTDDEEVALRERVAALQSAILEQRARRRALLTLKSHAEAKIPQCEHVLEQLSSIMEQHCSASESGAKVTVDDVVEASERLDDAVSALRTRFL